MANSKGMYTKPERAKGGKQNSIFKAAEKRHATGAFKDDNPAVVMRHFLRNKR